MAETEVFDDFSDSEMLDEHPELPDSFAPHPSNITPEASSRVDVLAKIEGIFEAMTDVLLNERGQLSIALKTKPSAANVDTANAAQSGSIQHIRFPGNNEREAWRFAVVTRILELIHEAVQSDVVLSKREIYYRDPALFGRQSHVDRYVDIIARTFEVPRAALHVIAAAKGLIAGSVSFCRRDGTIIDASTDKEGLLVPNLNDVLSADLNNVKWILVIEKEATFRSIAASSFWDTLSGNGIMVTAKGYPDVSTRAMLRFLSTPKPHNGFSSPPVHALVDFDPDGLAIFSTYKHGSENLSHESSHLDLDQLQWLGLQIESVLDDDSMRVDQGLLTLSRRNRAKATKMLGWEILAGEDGVRKALQIMLMLNIKAELQSLNDVPGAMNAFLESRLPS